MRRLDWMKEALNKFNGNAELLLDGVVGALSGDEAREIFDHILRHVGTNRALDIEIGRRDRYELLDQIRREVFGNADERLLEDVVRAMSEQEAEEVFEYIARMHDIEIRGIREIEENLKESGSKPKMKLSIYECPECEEEFEAPETLSERVYTCPYCFEHVMIESSDDEKLVEALEDSVNTLTQIERTSEYYNTIYEIADELGVPVYYRDMQSIPKGAIESLVDDMNQVDSSDPEAVKDVLKDYNLIPKNA